MTSPNPIPPPDPNETDELVHQDDAVIGRAFRWSILGLAILLAGAAGLFLYWTRPPEKQAEHKTTITAPASPPQSDPKIPEARFTNITRSAGISFTYNNGATGEKLLPESLGGGVAFFDADNDHDPDLLFINATWWPWDKDTHPDHTPTTAALYRNDGDGRFTEVTHDSGLDIPFYGMGVSCADFDNDGDRDVFVTCVGLNRLFRNDGNFHFTDITETAGLGGDPADWSTACTWFDYDKDGRLDLFVANYVKWSRAIDFEVNFTIDGTHRAYGPPTDFQGAFPRLYHNEGGGKFLEVSETSGIRIKNPATEVPMAKSLGVAPVDIDRDGWIDLIVANDTVPNFLFHNQGDGTFEEIGSLAGVAYDPHGRVRGAMGIDVANYRNDSAVGIAIGNFANEMTALFVSQGAPFPFADEAIAEGIGPASRLPLKFGIFFFDYDLDGWLDLLSVNGHLDEDITRVQASQQYAQPAQLFWNANGNGFRLVEARHAGEDLFQPIVGRGSAYADIDGDGDLDLVLTQVQGSPLLLRNDLQSSHSWLRVLLVGHRSNRDAIGARVTLTAGGLTQHRRVMPTRSYLSQSERILTFGWGNKGGIERLEIIWPSGSSQTVSASTLSPKQLVIIEEPETTARTNVVSDG